MATLRSEASRVHPQECCGLLLGHGDAVVEARPARNVAPDPDRHFEIDPQALVDAHRAARRGEYEVIGYYHSHPTGSASPSQTDRAGASGDGRVWAIVAGREIRFWRDDPDGFVAIEATGLPDTEWTSRRLARD